MPYKQTRYHQDLKWDRGSLCSNKSPISLFSNKSPISLLAGGNFIIKNCIIFDNFSDIQFGFWFAGDDGHVHDLPHQQPEEHQSRPGCSLPSRTRENDILHLRILETLNNMAAERYRLHKSSKGGMNLNYL
jgi:hypothetical protein